MDLSIDNVTTVTGQTFSGEDTAKLFALIQKRFGYDNVATACAVARLMEYCGDPSAPDYISEVAERASYGATLLQKV